MKLLRPITALLSLALVLVACASVVRQPAAATRPIAASSLDVAVRAALAAASSTNWTPTTISTETGYILAQRDSNIVGRDSGETYRLEIQLPAGGNGEIRARVVPPAGVMGGPNPQTLVAAFLDAYEQELRR